MKNVIKLFLPLVSLLIFSCANDSESDLLDPIPENVDDVNDDEIVDAVTFTADIQPIIANNCLGCHSSPPRNGAPFALVTFQQVSSRNGGVLRTVSLQTGQPGAMPPAGRIPQASIDLINQWIEDGLIE
ncbi:hypothetical protein [Flagellimonas meridianipacifica]|uniref:Cytochrome c domain-containing protein n=1 Tax=Flagellimonas meridianipacifica TaxID=1080225 RepID=A0A2T0MK07_9FLAO|nr:hypothetical protein [Allomuricauda pacifica]PRX57914.1 hypothetical protein CLV81_1928 [Allomuricauda pacifica]